MTEASILRYRLVCEDDTPDGDAAAGQGREEEGFGIERVGEAGVVGEEVREDLGTGQAGGKAESVEKVGRGSYRGGEEGDSGEIVGEDDAF